MPTSLTFLCFVALSSGQLLIWQKQQTNEIEVTYSADMLRACERQRGSLPKRRALVCLDVAVTGEGNGKPLQHSCLENPMNSMKRQKDTTLKDELPPTSVDATGEEQRNST